MAKKETATVISNVSNDADSVIALERPYMAEIDVVGSADILFHRWSVESVQAKADAAKGSKAKKTDDVDSYVYRMPNGNLAIPVEYFRQSVINAAKYRQDPRSPRKSMMDLTKAAIANAYEFSDMGVKDWDFIDRRRVVVQRNGITRSRPALHAGWKTTFSFLVLLPEYINQSTLLDLITSAGRLIGVGNFRPSYGRFQVTGFRVIAE